MATKEMKALLLTTGTAFLSGGVALIAINNYIGGAILAVVGIGAFYVREIMKGDES